MLSKEYHEQIAKTVNYVTTSDEVPPCCGVVDEFAGKKPTGNKILNRECEYCDNKFKCHPDLQALPDVNSKAVKAKIKYYLGKVIRPNAA